MLGFSVRELMSLIAPSSAAKPGLDSELVDLVSWLCPRSSASGRVELEPGTGALAHWLSNIWARFHCCGTWPHLCSNEQEIMMIYTSWDLPFLHSGQVSPWGQGLGVLHPWGGDPVGLGGPAARVKLNFSYQYSCIPWLLQDIQTGKWGFRPFTLPLYLTKNPSCKRAPSTSVALWGHHFSSSLPSNPAVATFPTPSALWARAGRTQFLLVCVRAAM